MGEPRRVAALRADGTEFPFDAALANFEAKGKRLLAVIGRDATAEVRAAQEVRALNASLEVRVAERTAELEATNRDLESFSYSVSHDLRAPIRAINGFARMLEKRDGAALSNEGRRLLGVILRNSRRMGTLVGDLLRLSRVGRSALSLQKVDIAALARQVAGELQTRYPAARLEIGELPPAQGDRALIEQVLVNLLGNALKYSSARPDPEVMLGASRQNGATAYFVRDNGAGFDPRYAARLFEPFQRLHGAEFEGSGIGLAIVRRIIERHGGRIWAESAPGKGATFYFTLGPATPG